MSRVDRSKIQLQATYRGEPFRPLPTHEILLDRAGLKDSVELLVFERGGQRRAVLLPEIAYHFIVQGELAGEPYMVCF